MMKLLFVLLLSISFIHLLYASLSGEDNAEERILVESSLVTRNNNNHNHNNNQNNDDDDDTTNENTIILFALLSCFIQLFKGNGWCNSSNQTPSTPTPTLAPVPTLSPTAAPTDLNFNIQLDLPGLTTSSSSSFAGEAAIFRAAADRWEDVIQGGFQDIFSTSTNLDPPMEGCVYPDSIDDLYICSKIEWIDGVGGILGRARPIYIRRSNNIPVIGEMEFDSSDIDRMRNDGTLFDTILHEMGHVLGIGTVWEDVGALDSTVPPCSYSGRAANREWRIISGCIGTRSTTIPLEQNLGAGSDCGHWDEECFDREIMTPRAESNEGVAQALSRLTIASLEDIGYTVDYLLAEPYDASDVSDSCKCNNNNNRRQRRRRRQNLSSSSSKEVKNNKERNLSGSSSSSSSSSRPQLSPEGRQKMIDYGQQILKREVPSKARTTVNDDDDDDDDDVVYYKGNVISIVAEENGTIYSLLVTLEM